ncbi:MAG: hypothetical protein IPI64_06900 [Chloracidobacterium sp.]|nr:hypothetical protein [Chloracidobacterium sp.]
MCLPLGYVIVLIGYFLASFAGGFIVTKMSRQVSQGITLPVVVGTFLTLGMIGNIFMLPGQPMWFIVIGLLDVYYYYVIWPSPCSLRFLTFVPCGFEF